MQKKQYACCRTPQPSTTTTRRRWSTNVWLLGLLLLLIPIAGQSVYFSTSSTRDIGWENPLAAAGNPLKGLLGSPSFQDYDPSVTSIDSSMDFYYVGLKEVMFGNPDIVGYDAAFDWEYIETKLVASAARHRHSILTFNLHYPSKPSNIPQYLIDAGIKTYPATSSFDVNGTSPDYGDPILLKALEQFITALGEKYDGDKRIAFMHLGLLGFWGEWHTFPFGEWVPEHAKQSVTQWYANAFQTTKLQARYPYLPAYQAGFGLYDGSFAFHTLDGDANGGIEQDEWYFWPLVEQAGQADFWRSAPMGGETRPELQTIIFEPTYHAGTFEQQDFVRCTYTTHASYIFHHDAFKTGGYVGAELEKAIESHARLGYNFLITRVAALKHKKNNHTIDVIADLRQIGVAPFYYDLDLVLDCDELSTPRVLAGAEFLVEDLATTEFTFENIPATTLCLQSISFHLQSSYGFPERPIKFAQGLDGKVALAIPMPDGAQPHPEDSGTWGAVSGFLVSKVIEKSYESLGTLNNGDELDLADYGDELWTIQANITDAHSATFHYNGQSHSVSHSSFSLSGDVMGYSRSIDYLMTPGLKKVSVSAFNYDGEIVGYAAVEFTIIDSSTRTPTLRPTRAPYPAPTPAPTRAPTKVRTQAPTPAIIDSSTRAPARAQTPAPSLATTSGPANGISVPVSNHGVRPVGQIDKSSVISSDDPHGFNTPMVPTVQEMIKDQKQQSQKKLTMIFVWTIVPLIFLGVIIYLIRRLICRQGLTTTQKEVDINSDIGEDPPTHSDDEDGSGTTGPRSTSWSSISSPIFTIQEEASHESEL